MITVEIITVFVEDNGKAYMTRNLIHCPQPRYYAYYMRGMRESFWKFHPETEHVSFISRKVTADS